MAAGGPERLPRGDGRVIHRQIEREGVSTHVVYGLELIERCLARMALMVDTMGPRAGRSAEAAVAPCTRLFARLASWCMTTAACAT